MNLRRRPTRIGINVRLRPELLETLDEVAEEVVCSRSLIIERALEHYFLVLELPTRNTETKAR